MLKSPASRACLGALAVCSAGCSAIIALDHYRPCATSEECAGVADGAPLEDSPASSDAQADALVPDAAVADTAPDAPPTSCTAAKDCPATQPVCSAGVCNAVTALVGGTVGHQCVVLQDQTMWCWGNNDHGQLGRGAVGGQFYQPAPVTVLPKGTLVVEGAMGNTYSCARTSDGQVYCWGDGTTGGGTGNATNVSLPVKAAQLSGGSTGACAKLADDSVYCWGDNSYGDLGCDGVDASSGAPINPSAPRLLIPASEHVAQVVVGLQATCARGANQVGDDVQCFGNAAWGAMGDGRPVQNDYACRTSNFSGFATNALQEITDSDFGICAKDINAHYFCWGMNYVYYGVGLLWPPSNAQIFASPTAMPTVPFVGAQSISIGWLHSCLLTTTGNASTVECWGMSTHGEAGTVTNVADARVIAGLPSQITSIAAHRMFTCALASGQVWCWGDNQFATLGPPSLGTKSTTPVEIAW